MVILCWDESLNFMFFVVHHPHYLNQILSIKLSLWSVLHCLQPVKCHLSPVNQTYCPHTQSVDILLLLFYLNNCVCIPLKCSESLSMICNPLFLVDDLLSLVVNKDGWTLQSFLICHHEGGKHAKPWSPNNVNL